MAPLEDDLVSNTGFSGPLHQWFISDCVSGTLLRDWWWLPTYFSNNEKLRTAASSQAFEMRTPPTFQGVRSISELCEQHQTTSPFLASQMVEAPPLEHLLQPTQLQHCHWGWLPNAVCVRLWSHPRADTTQCFRTKCSSVRPLLKRRQYFPICRWNFTCFNLSPLCLVPVKGTTTECDSSLFLPIQYLYIWTTTPLSVLQAEQSQQSPPPCTYKLLLTWGRLNKHYV